MNKKSEYKTNIWENLKRTINYIWEVDKKYIFIILISTIISSFIPAMSLLVMQNIINMIQINKVNIELVFFSIIIYVLIDIFQTIMDSALGYYASKFKFKFNLEIKSKFLNKAGKLNLKDYENSETHDIIQRARYEGEGKLLAYFEMYIQILKIICTMISYIFMLMLFELWIVLIIIVIPTIKHFIIKKLNIKQFKIIKERTNLERKSSYWNYIITNGDNYKELKIYNLFGYFTRKYQELIRLFNNQDLNILKKSAIYLSIVNVAELMIDGFLFAYIVYKGYVGVILIGNVITYMQTIIQIKSNFQGLLQVTANLQKESLFIDQFYNFLDMNNKKELYNNSIQLKTINHINEIRIENLSYKYSNTQNYVLKNITMSIKSGEFYAIVGRNGSGKTTLLKILLGFYDDYEGHIYINNIDLKEIDKENYRTKVGALFQDFTKYEATLRENIGYGNLNIMENNNVITQTIKKFKIDYLANKHPKKLDVQLGYWFDEGKQISIGQWQKIALSRAFVKDADFYILDEPNAALDSISEYDLSVMYRELLANKIGLIIAHRFNNFINHTDKIIVLNDGCILENGTHEELLKMNGIYSELYNLQIGQAEASVAVLKSK